ncbi:MAG TPA: RNA polymerase subunit sigma-70, partial [Phycisphaeraceae bacterium]|nr:RNA polymerase subunit sigma-70 [Phycisphaeraceae bacterium]
MIRDLDPSLASLIELSCKRGWMAYEELNDIIPDELVDTFLMDDLMVVIDDHGIEMIDLLEYKARRWREAKKRGETVPESAPVTAEQDEILTPKEVALLQEALEAEPVAKRIDDPVRMYLTQMGTIPLLTRAEEIRLAKKIETTRMIFRRRVLMCDYIVNEAVKILEIVHRGELPFDRTMRISTAEEDAKTKIARRIPVNLPTLRRLLDQNREDWEVLSEGRRTGELDEEKIREIEQRLEKRRRKMAVLTEELSLRTGKIVPILRKLRSISKKMLDLEAELRRAERYPNRYHPEDIMVMEEELEGLRQLVLEEPQSLAARLKVIDRVYWEYEQGKRDLSGGNLRLVVSIAKK